MISGKQGNTESLAIESAQVKGFPVMTHDFNVRVNGPIKGRLIYMHELFREYNRGV